MGGQVKLLAGTFSPIVKIEGGSQGALRIPPTTDRNRASAGNAVQKPCGGRPLLECVQQQQEETRIPHHVRNWFWLEVVKALLSRLAHCKCERSSRMLLLRLSVRRCTLIVQRLCLTNRQLLLEW